MALEDDDNNTWILDLETALLEDCSATTIHNICKGRSLPESIRPEIWQVCLGIQSKGNQLVFFNEIFDLPEQSVLRDDCQQIVANLGNEDEDKVSVISDLESILTYYCKSSGLQYEKGNGWLEILLPLVALKLPRYDTYNLFEAIKKQYIPKICEKNSAVCHLFRLLLLYHDPGLCSLLDTKKITPDLYCLSWFQTLFAGTCSLPVIFCMWDLYFQQSDQFFVFFLALVMVLNARDQVMSMQNESKQKIVDVLSTAPCALEANDISDLCSLAQYYVLKTPTSFRRDLLNVLFHADSNTADNDMETVNLFHALCLPVSVRELVENAETTISLTSVESVRFFLVDCRPAEQYNAGHLRTAFHLDCNLMLQEPAAFSTAVHGLLSAQRQALAAHSAAGGEHLCFLGSGRTEEDQYTHMVVASFLQKHTHYVSMVTGGYKAVHDYLGVELNESLVDHSSQECLVCSSDTVSEDSETTKNSSSIDLFGKISAAMKSKSAEVKGKLIEYIVNPTGNNGAERHVSSSDKLGKRYRSLVPIFSIDEDVGPVDGVPSSDEDRNDQQEIVSLSTWANKPEIVATYKCREIKINGYMYDSHLLVSDSHIYVLRDMAGRKGSARIIVRRPLSSIVKITSKKKHPEVITFKYGSPDGQSLNVSDMDRFLIPNAPEATKLISQQILKHLKTKDDDDG